jgi:cytoskeletal protein CcmA (bactofilin family)
VDGNVYAKEQAVLKQSGTIRGNISAPRVVLEDGSRFKGSIDMEAKEAVRPEPPKQEASRPEPSVPTPAGPGPAPVRP